MMLAGAGYATDKSKVSEANEVGRDAVQDLVTILDYFDDAGREIKVTELPASKKEFIIKAFTSARDKVGEGERETERGREGGREGEPGGREGGREGEREREGEGGRERAAP